MAVNTQPDPNPPSLAFGLDRFAQLGFRHPRIVAALAVIVTMVTVYGFFNISVDRDLRDLFRGETEIYQTYADAAQDFVDPENQILVLVQGDIGDPDNLVALRDLQLELQLLPDVGNIFSPFSLREPPDPDGGTRAVIDDPAAGLTPELIEQIRNHPILGQAVLSENGAVLLYTVTHVEPKASLAEHNALIDDVAATTDELLADTDLSIQIAGFAAMRTEIVRLLQRDQIILNGSGIVVGFLLSLLLFRSFIGAAVTAAPAAIAGLTILGWNGALGIPVTILSNVVPALVMVLGYADGMHLTAAWRRHRSAGHSVIEAEWLTLREVAPACVLTSLTTAIAFLSMTISDVGIVRDFGWVGAIGTLVATAIVLLGHGLGVRLLGSFWKVGRSRNLLEWLSGPCAAFTNWVVGRARLISAIALAVVLGTAVGFVLVQPENSLSETLPTDSPMVRALSLIDEELGGAFPVQIVVPVADRETLTEDDLDRIRAAHQAVDGMGASRPLSLWSLAEWAGVEDAAEANELLSVLPDSIGAYFIGNAGALVSLYIVEMTTAETAALVDEIEEAVTAASPGAIVTGATVFGAREATRTINNLVLSLGLAVLVALGLLALAVRRMGAALVALIPNLLPIFAAGTLLYVLGAGMQLTSIVSLTIAFGIAIDDTIHYLNTFLQTRAKDVATRVVEAARQVGPVLIGTTIALSGGMAATQTSGLATVALFGLLAIGSLIVALFGDLVFLTAIIAGPGKRLLDRRKPRV